MRPEKTYLICATPRSGSYLLSYGLTRTQLAGNPDEYFQARDFFTWTERLGFKVGSFAEYVQGLFDARTVAGVFGAKIMWDHMEDCFAVYPNTIPELAGKPRHEQLDRLFNHPRYLFIVRRDKVRQAVSMVRALQTQIWQVWVDIFAEKAQPAQQPYFDFDWIEREFWNLTAAEQGWRDYFAASGIEPLTLVYEEFAERFEDTITDVLRYLEIDLPPTYVPPTPTIQKQSDALNESWVEQYYTEQKRRAELIQLADMAQAQANQANAALLEHRNELEARLRAAHQENAHLSSQLAALRAENDALRKQLEALQRQLAEMPRPVIELAARRVYRGVVPMPLRLKLRSLRKRR
jgi:LPS sulfotransferase NodH